MKYSLILLTLVITAFTFKHLGWFHAHSTVARECLMLGKFYVGDMVFVCSPENKK